MAKLVDLLKNVYFQTRDGELKLVASNLAFSSSLALIPFLTVVLATFQYFTNLESLYPQVESFLLSHFHTAIGTDATKWIRILLRNIQKQSLGFAGIFFLTLASFRLIFQLDSAIHRVWAIKNQRPFVKRFFAYWISMFLVPLLLAIYVGLGSSTYFNGLHAVIPVSVSNALVLFGVLLMIFKYVPNHAVPWVYAFWGALFSGVGILLIQKIFKLLAKQVFTYSKIYGSLASLPLVMIWLLFIWYVFLAGVALTASLTKNQLQPLDSAEEEGKQPSF